MAGFRGLVDVVENYCVRTITVMIIIGCVMSATYHAAVLVAGGDFLRHTINILANVMLVRWFFSKNH